MFSESFRIARKLKFIITINTIITLVALLIGYLIATSNIAGAEVFRSGILSSIADMEPIKNITELINQNKIWLAMLLTFGFNLGSAAFLTTTVTGIIFPYPSYILALRGVLIGFLFAGIIGGWIAIILFLVTLILEFSSYILSASAGANTGLALINPKKYKTSKNWKAFGLAWHDAFKLYPLIIILLAIAAVWEIGGIWLLK